VADAIGRHPERFGEGEAGDRALFHAGERRDALMSRAVEDRLFVLFIREDPEIVLLCQFRDRLKLVVAEDDAARVMWVAHHEEFRSWSDAPRQLIDIEMPLRTVPSK